MAEDAAAAPDSSGAEPVEWKEIFQQISNKYYYWRPDTDELSWTIPGTPWRKFYEPKSGKVYYCDTENSKTIWKLPEGVTVPEPARPVGSNPDIEDDAVPEMSESAAVEGKENPPAPTSPQKASGLDDSARHSVAPPSARAGSVERKEFPDSVSQEAMQVKQLGNTSFAKKDYRTAHDCYNRAIQLDSNCANFYFNRSATFFCLKDLPHALEDARRAVELAPGNISALARLGFSLFKLKEFEDAEKIYDEALSLDPGNSRVQKGLARVKDARVKASASAAGGVDSL